MPSRVETQQRPVRNFAIEKEKRNAETRISDEGEIDYRECRCKNLRAEALVAQMIFNKKYESLTKVQIYIFLIYKIKILRERKKE